MVIEEQRQRIARVLLNAVDSAGKPYINSLHVAERLADAVLIYAAHVLIDDSDATEEEVR